MSSGQVQPRLPGFLDLLQLKNQGRQPPDLADTTQLVMEVAAWYGLDRVVNVSGNGVELRNVVTCRSVVLFTVPAAEWWMLRGAALSFQADPTATALRISYIYGSIYLGGPSGLIRITDSVSYDSALYPAWAPSPNPVVRAAGTIATSPILIPPRTQIGYTWHGELTDPAANAAVNMQLQYTPLLV